ncbi:MAG: hypothetical protein R8K20_09895, partial [Gallionellaceae bacterium]
MSLLEIMRSRHFPDAIAEWEKDYYSTSENQNIFWQNPDTIDTISAEFRAARKNRAEKSELELLQKFVPVTAQDDGLQTYTGHMSYAQLLELSGELKDDISPQVEHNSGMLLNAALRHEILTMFLAEGTVSPLCQPFKFAIFAARKILQESGIFIDNAYDRNIYYSRTEGKFKSLSKNSKSAVTAFRQYVSQASVHFPIIPKDDLQSETDHSAEGLGLARARVLHVLPQDGVDEDEVLEMLSMLDSHISSVEEIDSYFAWITTSKSFGWLEPKDVRHILQFSNITVYSPVWHALSIFERHMSFQENFVGLRGAQLKRNDRLYQKVDLALIGYEIWRSHQALLGKDSEYTALNEIRRREKAAKTAGRASATNRISRIEALLGKMERLVDDNPDMARMPLEYIADLALQDAQS